MNHLHALVLVVLSTSLLACSAGDDGAAAATSPLTACSGRYTCKLPDQRLLTTPLKYDADGACTLGGFTLTADGVARNGSSVGSWSGDANHIDLCLVKDLCLPCDVIAPEPASTGKTCVGSPSSCSGNSPGSCGTIEGCRMATRVKYNGTYENTCEGSPDDCDEMDTQSSCERQGCDWK